MKIFFFLLLLVTRSFAVPWTFFESVLQHVRGPRLLPYNPEPQVVFSEYDFVIVGAGPAGCVLANRLSEVEEWKILLIEAGSYETFISDIPMVVSYFQFTDFNWHYLMERQEGVCEGMIDGRCHWPRGRGVGGSSIINYMIYTRGNRQDFLDLEAAGNYGWGPNETLYYYMKSEKAKLAAHPYSQYHGHNGYLNIEDVPYRSKTTGTFLEATKELGHKILDYNGEDQLGFSYLQATLVNGRRCSAAKAFLRPIRGRPNLHVIANTRVTKILINQQTKVAYGVEFIRKRQQQRVHVRKEVILSSGAFNSPQLLMLSGIGPKEHLQELGIPVIQDLRVGKNLRDHISFLGLSFFVTDVGISLNEQKLVGTPKYIFQWLNGTGPLTIPGGVEGIGYIKTKYNNFPGNQPDIELFFLAGSLGSDAGGTYRKSFHINDETYNSAFRDLDNADSVTIVPMLLHPVSKGELRLKSRDPFAWPRFYGNYYTHDIDIKRMVEGIKEGIRIVEKTKAFKIHQPRIHKSRYPQCLRYEFGTDEFWECALRVITATLHHQVGTCKMGPKSDPEAVVDPELRVHGISMLRVADTSIIPKPWSAHTNAPSFMIGEKCADMIKWTWNKL